MTGWEGNTYTHDSGETVVTFWNDGGADGVVEITDDDGGRVLVPVLSVVRFVTEMVRQERIRQIENADESDLLGWKRVKP